MIDSDILSDGSLTTPDGPDAHQDPKEADSVLDKSEQLFEARKREQIIRERDQTLSERDDEHELRKIYIRASFVLVVGVTFMALFLTTANGLNWINLPDSVIITLLTTTTANVIGILLIAFNWLFPKR